MVRKVQWKNQAQIFHQKSLEVQNDDVDVNAVV
jgi:hypothetical protein